MDSSLSPDISFFFFNFHMHSTDRVSNGSLGAKNGEVSWDEFGPERPKRVEATRDREIPREGRADSCGRALSV